jgi:protein-S-isoprenylcysteine O-methyltransferase Ste14
MVFFLIVIAPVLALCLAYLGFATLSANSLGYFLLLMGLSYVVGGPLYAWKWKARPPARKEERGDRSFWLVQPGFIIAIYGAPLEWLFLPDTLPRTLGMQIAGWLLLSAAIGLLVWARKALAGKFSGHVQIQPDHSLVQSGPYRLVRHPGYLGYLLLVLGLAAGYSSLVSLGAAILLLLPGLVYRIKVEERLLAAEFGEEYRLYTQKTQRLIPGIW